MLHWGRAPQRSPVGSAQVWDVLTYRSETWEEAEVKERVKKREAKGEERESEPWGGVYSEIKGDRKARKAERKGAPQGPLI